MIFLLFLMTINPTHHIYNIQLIKNVFQWNLFISKFSSAAPTINSMMSSKLMIGFHATNGGLAIEDIRQMRLWRLLDIPWREGDKESLRDPSQPPLAGNVASMSATCHPDSQMSALLANIFLLWQHKTYPDTVFSCWGLPTLTPFFLEYQRYIRRIPL